MKNSSILFIVFFILHSWNGNALSIELNNYHRSSLYSIVLRHPEQLFANDIITAFNSIPIPEKYNDHNLKNKVMVAPTLQKMSKEELEGAYKDAIHTMLKRNKIGGRLIEKWFNRDKETGAFNMELIKERGQYNASIIDVQEALKTVRGMAIIKDAGEELLAHTYVLVNDIRYANADVRKNLQGFASLLSMFIPFAGPAVGIVGTKINERVVGFKVYVTSYLFRLDWNDEVASDFYNHMWQDELNLNSERKTLFDQKMGSFKLNYIGCTTIYSGDHSLAGVRNESDMFLKVCTRSIDKAISELQKSFDEFKVYTPLISTNPLSAYIGMKEGMNEDSRYEVLEVSTDEDGRTTYVRVGEIKPVKDKIWDNRFMADAENIEEARFGFTTFEKVSGKDFYPGMLIREIGSNK